MPKNTSKKKDINIRDEIAQMKDVATQIQTKVEAGDPNGMILKAMTVLKRKDRSKSGPDYFGKIL